MADVVGAVLRGLDTCGTRIESDGGIGLDLGGDEATRRNFLD